MPIITISRGSYSRGKEVAEKVAARLKYDCLSREVLLEASEHFNIPETKLVRALHDAPSILDRFFLGKERYVAFITMAFLDCVRKDNVVYHGLAGHFFLKGVAHALKVRIVSNIEARVREEVAREGITADEALRVLRKDDEERRRWSQSLYGVDTHDPGLYDLVIHINKLSVEDAVDLICQAAGLPQFEATPQSQQVLDDLTLSARIRAALVGRYPQVAVRSDRGRVFVDVEASPAEEKTIIDDIHLAVTDMEDLKEIRVNVRPFS
jgi:hypothetical protein